MSDHNYESCHVHLPMVLGIDYECRTHGRGLFPHWMTGTIPQPSSGRTVVSSTVLRSAVEIWFSALKKQAKWRHGIPGVSGACGCLSRGGTLH